MAKTVFDVLIDRLDQEREDAQQFLSNGNANDYPSYREVVGLIRGLNHAKQSIEDMAKNYAEDDDD